MAVLDVPAHRRGRRSGSLSATETDTAGLLEVSLAATHPVGELLHRGVGTVKDVRGRSFPLGVGLGDHRLHVGRRSDGQGVDGLPQRAEEPGDRDNHVGGIQQGLQPGVDEGGGQLLGFLANVLHRPARLDVVLHRGVVTVLDALDALHGLVGPGVDLVAGLTGESLVETHVVGRVVGLVEAAHDGVVVVVGGVQRRGAVDGGDQTHESVVHGAVNHGGFSLSLSDVRRQVLNRRGAGRGAARGAGASGGRGC